MQRIVGKQGLPPGGVGGCTTSAAEGSVNAGPAYPWEGSVAGVNTANGNKLTEIPIVGWTARGGLPVQFSLYHNSQGSTANSGLGSKWSHSYDIALIIGTNGNGQICWGSGASYVFTANVGGTFTAPAGIHDTLVANGSPTVTSYDLTTPDQVKYHFGTYNSSFNCWQCTTITDGTGNNTVTINYNTNGRVSTIVDPTSRTLTLSYNSSCYITGIEDPLSRSWTVTPDSNGNVDEIQWPALSGTTYNIQLGYDTGGHSDITSVTDKRGYVSNLTYNSSNDSCATISDPYSNEVQFTYSSGQTKITDPNNHVYYHNYTSGLLSSVEDPLTKTESYSYDSNNNRTDVYDRNTGHWHYTFSTAGDCTSETDPQSHEWQWTWNSKHRCLTETWPSGDETVNTYDTTLNFLLTKVQEENSSATVLATTLLGYDSSGYGLLVSKEDNNSHTTTYGHNSNGELTSVTTPGSHETQWTVDGLGVCTSREDALSRTTNYTLDNWERVSKTTYPDTSTHTFSFDANSNLIGWTDGQGTWARVYDKDNRCTSESLNSTTRFSYTFDGSGQKGLLSTMTDPGARGVSYSYTARNELYSVSESAGTHYYSYDPVGNPTGETLENSATVTRVFDSANRLSSVANKNSSGTMLSSFSYGYSNDNQRTSMTEADGSVVDYGYDAQHHLTSEDRTGTNPYSITYTVDGVGNRTAQTVGSTSTSFTLNSDDELTATSGGFATSYSYNSNGEQTGRTLAGTSSTLGFDYDGQLTSITTGSSTVSFAYDALGRRISRTAGGTTTQFLSGVDGNVWREAQGSTTTAVFTWGNGLCRKDGEYPMQDGQGNERTVLNSAQTVTGTLNLDAFGNKVGSTGSSGDPYMYGQSSRYRNDRDCGLTLVGARYYDSQVGRFITRDTDLTQHAYAYCEHDPVNAVDPSGHRGDPSLVPRWVPEDGGDCVPWDPDANYGMGGPGEPVIEPKEKEKQKEDEGTPGSFAVGLTKDAVSEAAFGKAEMDVAGGIYGGVGTIVEGGGTGITIGIQTHQWQKTVQAYVDGKYKHAHGGF